MRYMKIENHDPNEDDQGNRSRSSARGGGSEVKEVWVTEIIPELVKP